MDENLLKTRQKNKEIFSKVVSVFLVVNGCVMMWIGLNLRDMNVAVVLTAMQATSYIHDEANWQLKSLLTLKMMGVCGIAQFLLTMFSSYNYMSMLLVGLGTYLTMITFPRRSVAMVLLITYAFSLKVTPGYQQGISRAIDFGLAGIVILSSIFIANALSNAFYPNVPREAPPPEKLNPFPKTESFKVAILMFCAVFYFKYSDLIDSYFFVITIAFSYYAKLKQPSLRIILNTRTISTPLGIYLGFLYMGLLMFFDYKFIYLAPIIASLSVMFLIAKKNYLISSTLTLMTLILLIDFQNSSTLNITQTFIMRVLNTYLAILLIFFIESTTKSETKNP